MTVGISPITHPVHRDTRQTRTQRIVSVAASAARLPRSVLSVGSHAGQLGPVRESDLGRHTGARI